MTKLQRQKLARFFRVLNDPLKYPHTDTLAEAAIKAKAALNSIRKVRAPGSR